MKKRIFLKTGVAFLGATWLSHYLLGKSEVVAAKNYFEINKTEEEWRKILSPQQFAVLRKHGTERAGSSSLDKQYAKGTYVCAGCALPVFLSTTKFDSGTGWPSFYAPIKGAIGTTIDNAFFITRVEVHCHRCGGHLGHVFDDGPKPTGKRYCMNGISMKFIPA